MTNASILWRRLDLSGHESARIFFDQSHWNLEGTAVFAYNKQPCRLSYQILCDADWQTLSTKVTGWIANQSIEIEISVDDERCWWINSKEQKEVSNCLDIDLNFSPSTNLLPIRRLGLEIGQEAIVSAAWLRFPSFKLEALEQKYRRIDENMRAGGGVLELK